jgi:hypothetical protein
VVQDLLRQAEINFCVLPFMQSEKRIRVLNIGRRVAHWNFSDGVAFRVPSGFPTAVDWRICNEVVAARPQVPEFIGAIGGEVCEVAVFQARPAGPTANAPKRDHCILRYRHAFMIA